MKTQSRALYLSHGGGPLPVLGDGRHDEMLVVLRAIAKKIFKPECILLVSAHWEASQATLTASQKPELIYDYYGFPESAYQIEYPAPGHPQLAQGIAKVFEQQAIPVVLDAKRGFDHGLFIPLKIMYPEADIPCVQLSLLDNLDAASHIALGEALSKLEQNGLLIIGSGFSFHNIQAYEDGHQASNRKNQLFENWLIRCCSSHSLTETERKQSLIDWQEAPHARYCHPREEHLLPLHVCYGAAQSACREVFELTIFDKKASMYLW